MPFKPFLGTALRILLLIKGPYAYLISLNLSSIENQSSDVTPANVRDKDVHLAPRVAEADDITIRVYQMDVFITYIGGCDVRTLVFN